MKQIKRLRRRGFALFLALAVCMSTQQITAFADDGSGNAGVESSESGNESYTSNDDTSSSDAGSDAGSSDTSSDAGSSDNSSTDSGTTDGTGDDVDSGSGDDSGSVSEDNDTGESVYSSAEDAGVSIPDDASTSAPTVTETTDPVTSNTTTTTTTDTSWEYKDEANSSTTPNSGVEGDVEKVDNLTGITGSTDKGDEDGKEPGKDNSQENVDGDKYFDPNNPDYIGDGTYTKKETDTTTTVDVNVSGSQAESSGVTTDADGNVIKETNTIQGSQTTTTTTTTEGTETITTVKKETGETTKEDGEKKPGEVENDGDPQKVGESNSDNFDFNSTGTPDSKMESENKTASGKPDGITVTMGPDKNDSKDIPVINEQPTEEETKAMLKDLAGYNLVDEKGNSIGSIGEDGSITMNEGEAAPVWTKDSNGNWNLTISNAAKANGDAVEDEQKEFDPEKDRIDKEEKPGSHTDPTTITPSSDPEWENLWTKETVTLEDGITIDTYTHTGTGTRVDQETWVQIYDEVRHMRQFYDTASKTIVVSQGEAGKIVGTWGGVTDNHGQLTFNSLTTAAEIQKLIDLAKADKKDPGWQKHHMFWGTSIGNNNAVIDSPDVATYTDLMIQSTVKINETNGKSNAGAWIRKLTTKDNQEIYVYCAQHGAPANLKEGYEITNVSDPSILNSYDISKDDADHIQYIAQNGYWGTEDTLTTIKNLLGNKTTKDGKGNIVKMADSIDQGMALAVTQAAIWYYSSDARYTENPFTECLLRTNPKEGQNNVGTLDPNEQAAMKELFNSLISGTANESDTTDIITADDIKSTSITVLDKVESTQDVTNAVEALKEESSKSTAAETNNTYNTNVSFTVAVVPSRINGDVIVYVYQDGKTAPIASARLDGQTKNGVSGASYKKNSDGTYTYTLNNVHLTENLGIKLHISGTQNLKEGAYLYRTDLNYSESQTFVGMTAGGSSKEVNLDVNMSFNVQDGKSKTESTTTKGSAIKTWDETTTYEQKQHQDTTVTENYKTVVTVTTTVTEQDVKNEDIKASTVRWQDSNSRTYDPNEGDDDADADSDADTDSDADADTDDDGGTYTPSGGGSDDGVPRTTTRIVRQTEIPDGPVPLATILDDNVPLASIPDDPVPLVSIFDEEVPLAAVPRTGDDSGIWYVVTLLSVMGLAWLSIVGKKKQEES